MDKLRDQEIHRKVILSGVPENVMLGLKDFHVSLPALYMTGMLNIHGGGVQLKFDLNNEILFLKTMNHVEKIQFNKIINISSEAIENKEEYSIVGLHFGPADEAIFWLYWVPSQFIKAMRNALLGKWPGLYY